MAKPKLTTRPVEKSISLPETLCARVDAFLLCPITGKTPHGAWAQLVGALLETYLEKYGKKERREA